MAFAPFDLSGMRALVTGGNGGIGLGMADGLARAGADLCIWGTDAGKNAAARERLAVHGTRVTARVCDIADEAAVEAATAETLAEMGRIDACFANAGVSSDRRGTIPKMGYFQFRPNAFVMTQYALLGGPPRPWKPIQGRTSCFRLRFRVDAAGGLCVETSP